MNTMGIKLRYSYKCTSTDTYKSALNKIGAYIINNPNYDQSKAVLKIGDKYLQSNALRRFTTIWIGTNSLSIFDADVGSINSSLKTVYYTTSNTQFNDNSNDTIPSSYYVEIYY